MCYRNSRNCSCIFTKQSSAAIAEYVLVVMCAIKSLTHNLRYSCTDANKRLLWMLVHYNLLNLFFSIYIFWAILGSISSKTLIKKLTNFQNSLNFSLNPTSTPMRHTQKYVTCKIFFKSMFYDKSWEYEEIQILLWFMPPSTSFTEEEGNEIKS